MLPQHVLPFNNAFITAINYHYHCFVFSRIIFILSLLLSLFNASAQQDVMSVFEIDSMIAAEDSLLKLKEDSMRIEAEKIEMMNDMHRADSFISFSNNMQQWLAKKFTVRYDVQQRREQQSSANMFIVLLLMLLLLTYLKLAFANDLEELWLSVSSGNRAVQIFRTQTDTITVSSFLLTANFVLSCSLFIQLSLQKFSPSLAVESRTTTFYLIILFTCFLLVRTLALRIIGFVFSLNDVTALYEFHFVRIAQTLGLTLLPTVLLMYALNEKFFSIVFVVACIICVMAVALLMVRGLSTSAKVLISNVKYFFIYVCVGEVTLAFFFFKLLTKIVT